MWRPLSRTPLSVVFSGRPSSRALPSRSLLVFLLWFFCSNTVFTIVFAEAGMPNDLVSDGADDDDGNRLLVEIHQNPVQNLLAST